MSRGFHPPLANCNATNIITLTCAAVGGSLRVYLEKLAEAKNVPDFVQQNRFGQHLITE